jgi:hypothetical protein
VQRYQWEKPGDMIHVDIKQQARFEGSATASQAIVANAVRGVLATRRCMWPSTTPHA